MDPLRNFGFPALLWTADPTSGSLGAAGADARFPGPEGKLIPDCTRRSMTYRYGAGGVADGYQGFTSTGSVLGAFCIPVSVGQGWLVRALARAAALDTGFEAFRITMTFKGDGSLWTRRVSAFSTLAFGPDRADRLRELGLSVKVPPGADPFAKLAVEFARGSTAAKDFLLNQLWLEPFRSGFRIDTALSTLVASPTSILHGSGQSTITVTVKNSDNQPTPGVIVWLESPTSPLLSGVTFIQPIGPTNASGVATGTFKAASAGSYEIYATADGIGIGDPDVVEVT